MEGILLFAQIFVLWFEKLRRLVLINVMFVLQTTTHLPMRKKLVAVASSTWQKFYLRRKL